MKKALVTSMALMICLQHLCGCGAPKDQSVPEAVTKTEQDTPKENVTEVSGKDDDKSASADSAESAEALSLDEPRGESEDPDKPRSLRDMYQDILYLYKEAEDGGYTMEQVEDMGLDTELVQHGWPYAGAGDNAGYLFYDLDSDGEEELIITYYDDIIDIYGFDGEKTRCAFSTPYRGVTTLFPDGMLRLDYGIAANYYSSTWYKYDCDIGNYFPVFQDRYDQENGQGYYTSGYYSLSEEERARLIEEYRSSGECDTAVSEWTGQLTEQEYEDIVPDKDAAELPKAQPLSTVKLPEGYASALAAATTLRPGETLESRLLEESGAEKDELALFHEEDFDGDGQQEAFALIGTVTDEYSEPLLEGSVWFVSPKECKKLRDFDGMGSAAVDRTMRIGNTDYVMFDEIYATGTLTYVWYVSNGRAADAQFSAKGKVVFWENDTEHFCIMDSSYDCMYDTEIDVVMGHTWKYYYFYYDSLYGMVMEYGGTEIDADTVKDVCGKDIIAQLIPQDGAIDTIYYRDNGQIVINYNKKEDGDIYYYHYIYNLPRECLVDDTALETGDEPLQGVVLKALCPEMAVYPDEPKGENWYGN